MESGTKSERCKNVPLRQQRPAMERSGIEEEEDIPLSLIATEVQHQKLLAVQVQDMGHEGSAGVTDGKDGDEDDRVDVFLSVRKIGCRIRTVKKNRRRGDWGL